MGKRIIRTVDDAALAIREMCPEGFSVYFQFERYLCVQKGRLDEHTEFKVWGFERGAGPPDVEKLPRLEAYTAAGIVRKFIEEFLPATRPKPPKPVAPVRGHLAGKQPPRLEFQPMQAIDPTSFSRG